MGNRNPLSVFSADLHRVSSVRAFISVDLEIVSYVIIPGHLSLKSSVYDVARKTAAGITLIVAEELNKKWACPWKNRSLKAQNLLNLKKRRGEGGLSVCRY